LGSIFEQTSLKNLHPSLDLTRNQLNTSTHTNRRCPTFYEFSINKLNYNLNGKFGEFNYLMNGYSNPSKSPIIYDGEDYEGYILDDNLIKGYCYIGAVIGCKFFTDGNDTVLLYNEKENKVLSVNHYS